MCFILAAITFLSVFIVSAIASRLLIFVLQRHNVIDIPNDRSNHSMPIPRGGGLALLTGVLLGVVLVNLMLPQEVNRLSMGALCACVAIVAAVSFRDDIKSLSARWRFLAQMIAVILAYVWVPYEGLVFQGWLPPMADHMVSAVLWLWFINLYNFMDGMDGLTGSQTIFICLGFAVIAFLGGAVALTSWGYLAVIISAAALGFLLWNWHPARLFLGDIGSISLGFMLGWLLLELAREGYWVAALLLPAYYVADSSLTLLHRMIRKQPVWKPHSEHFYQKALRRGMRVEGVLLRVILANAVLMGLAIISVFYPVPALRMLAVGGVVVAMLLMSLRGISSHQ